MTKPRDVMAAYETAAVDHDLDATMSYVDDDATYFFSNQTSHIGKTEVREAIKANFEAISMEHYEISDLECISETDDVAVFLYEFRWTGLVGGSRQSGSGRGTSVLVRSGDSWRILHEHLSRGPFKNL